MRLIFLDIDGVLNGHDFCDEAQSSTISHPCVWALNRILRETDARIVLSSAWRYMIHGEAMTLTGFEYLLRTHGVISGRLIGLTRKDDDIADPHERSAQVLEWLADHSSEWERYVVLDDDDLGFSAKGMPWVQTDRAVGLTYGQDADKAIALLYGEVWEAVEGSEPYDVRVCE